MKLTYSILWFDDDKDLFESIDMDSIRDEISALGFTLKVVPVHNGTDFNGHSPFKEFDMIIVDFNLGDEQGDTFIERVRSNDVYSEIIFYSFAEASDLWKAIHDRQLEGVFVTNKKSIETKVTRVARQSVRKVLDLENMRGIVMSEVGDLDALLEDIFEKAMNGISDEQKLVVFNKFHKESSRQVEERQLALAAFKDAPSIEGLLELCDSNKRWSNYMRVKKQHDVLKRHGFEEDYVNEILRPRNFLAHGVPERIAEDTMQFSFSGGGTYTFNDQVSQELRKKIIEYKLAFKEIVSLLNT